MRWLLAILVVSLGAERATACSCLAGDVDVVMPQPGSTNVDRRAAIVALASGLTNLDDQELGLTVALDDGTAIAADVAVLIARNRQSALIIAKPQPEWPAETSLVITASAFGSLRSFVVRTGAQSTAADAPRAPLVSAEQVVIEGLFTLTSSCGPHNFSATVFSSGNGVLIRDFGVNATSDAPVDGEPSGFGPFINDSACSVSDLPQPLTFGSTFRARFAEVGVDGAVSRWGNAVDLAMPQDRDCDGVGDSVDACPDANGNGDGIDTPLGCGGQSEFRCEPSGALCHTTGFSSVPECSAAASSCASATAALPFALVLLALRRPRTIVRA
jgi:hypothetical protein